MSTIRAFIQFFFAKRSHPRGLIETVWKCDIRHQERQELWALVVVILIWSWIACYNFISNEAFYIIKAKSPFDNLVEEPAGLAVLGACLCWAAAVWAVVSRLEESGINLMVVMWSKGLAMSELLYNSDTEIADKLSCCDRAEWQDWGLPAWLRHWGHSILWSLMETSFTSKHQEIEI